MRRTIDRTKVFGRALVGTLLLFAGPIWAINGTFTVTETWRVEMSYTNWAGGQYSGTKVHTGTENGTIVITDSGYTMLNRSGVPLSPEARYISSGSGDVIIDGGTVMPTLSAGVNLTGHVYLTSFIVPVPIIDGEIPTFYQDDDFDTSGPDLSSLAGYGKLTGSSLTVTATSSVSITPAPGPPVIDGHPESQSVDAGSPATFEVVARGTPTPSYLWQKLSGSIWQDISGQTSSTFTVSSVSLADAGSYRARVSNSYGSVYSNSASLTILTPDLVAGNSSSISPPTIPAGDLITLAGSTRNIGTGVASPFLIKFYLSTDQVIDNLDTDLGNRSFGAIAASGSQSISENFTIPESQALGTYYICWQIDAGNTVAEVNETNNNAHSSTTVTITAPRLIGVLPVILQLLE